MTRAKSGTGKAPRAARSKRASSDIEGRESVDRAIDEVVDDTIDAMVERLSEAPQRSVEASHGARLTVDPGKQKLIRDSFTIPKNEYQTLDLLKSRLLRLSYSARKSELLRAGVAALARMSDGQLLAAIAVVPNLKTGRPSKSGTSKKKD